MAGSYPDAPDRRIAWDADGTVVTGVRDNNARSNMMIGEFPEVAYSDFTLAQKQAMNDDDAATYVGGTGGGEAGTVFLVLVFPELRDLSGYLWQIDGYKHATYLAYSTDTTNGRDGTWQAWGSQTYHLDTLSGGGKLVPQIETYREAIVNEPISGVRSVIFWEGATGAGSQLKFRAVHIYGNISPGSTPDRLLFIDDATGLEFTEVLDWGDVPRGTTLDYDMLVKNNSASLTANTNVLDFEALTGVSDTWYTIKETGGSFGTTLSITSISPGATYPTGGNVITIRLVVADAATLGVQTARLKLSTGSWT